MNLHEKLIICERYIRDKGYRDAAIVSAGLGAEMIVFRIPNVTAKYPNERPNVSVAFAHGTMNAGDIDFDVMQVLCFISSGIPEERLPDIQRFCSDFNKAMQIGFFGVDYKNASVYFKSAQVVDKNITRERLEICFDNVLTMILFYFGYVYEILIELSFGVIGYGSTPGKLRERKRMMKEAMAELRPEDIKPEPPADPNAAVIEELFNQLKEANPEVLKQANIDIDDIRRRRSKPSRSRQESDAEKTALQILKLAEEERNGKRAAAAAQRKAAPKPQPQQSLRAPDEGARVAASSLSPKSDEDSLSYKNQMPSVEMYAKRGQRRQEPPLDMEELRRALEIEQKERARINAARKQSETELDNAIRGEKISGADIPVANAKRDPAADQESLLARLKKWTQN